MNNKWDRRFLELAKHISSWSKDPSTKIGAIIVDSNRVVVGQGYNGFPRGVHDHAERYADREIKYSLVVHGEVNAVIHAGHRSRGGILYVWPTLMMPNVCPECAKVVVQAGIKRVVYYHADAVPERWEKLAKFTKIIFDEGGVDCVEIPELLH